MKLFFRIACLVLLLSGTRAQDDFGFDLADALDDVTQKPKSPDPPKKNDDFSLDLEDALRDDDPPTAKPKPPLINPNRGGDGGGSISDSDLTDLIGGGGGGGGGGGEHYKPDGGYGDGGREDGRYGGRGVDPASNPAYDDNSGSQQDQGSGKMAGIVGAIGVALVGAASSYFAYQKKKLCFKLQGGQDPERGNRHMTQSEPQVMSNLLQTS